MKKNAKALPLICWALAIIATAVIYALFVDSLFTSPTKLLSACFVILSEILLCVKSLLGKKSIILNTQMIFGGVYLAVTVILSLIFINVNNVNGKWFAAIHTILLVLLAIADLTVLRIEKRSSASDERIYKSQSVMASCQKAIDIIIANNPESEFKKELTEISEAIRYSDNSKLSGDEEQILGKLEVLSAAVASDEESTSIKEKINDVKALIQIRSIYIKDQQRGKF